jgi:hypothetical protein
MPKAFSIGLFTALFAVYEVAGKAYKYHSAKDIAYGYGYLVRDKAADGEL